MKLHGPAVPSWQHPAHGLGPDHISIPESAFWPHGPLPRANIDSAQQSWIEATNSHPQQLLYPDVSLPEQSWDSNNIYNQPQSVSEAIPGAPEPSLFQSGLNLIQPVAPSQPALSELSALSLPLPGPIKPAEAVVLQLPDGKFFCSQFGCDAVYLRPGDCRRHLKMHNGPFFPCTEQGCPMIFYRNDKLQDHLTQRHNVINARVGSRRR